jgi:hypothetical protein
LLKPRGFAKAFLIDAINDPRLRNAFGVSQGYIPGGPQPIGKLIELLLQSVGFLVALLLIWLVLRWTIKKRRK